MTQTAVQAPQTFADAQAVLAASLPGYTRRPHQMGLAEQIEQALADERSGLMQAGCGTGKSLAALIPVILSGKRTVVATATKALQEQYRAKDLPFLAEHLGVKFTWAILKGRSNYPCPVKIAELENPTAAQRTVITAVEAAAKTGEIVDQDVLPSLPAGQWPALAMTAAECPGASSCPVAKAGKCFAEQAKAEAADADVVITNVAYLMQDLQLRLMSDNTVQLLGEYDQVVVDEAHELPDIATGALSDTIGAPTFRKLAGDVGAFLQMMEKDVSLATGVLMASEVLWSRFDAKYAAFVHRGGKTDPMPLPLKEIIGELGGPFKALYQALDEARDEIKRSRPTDDRERMLRWRMMRRTENWLARLYAILTSPSDETVRWIEQEETEFRGRKETRRLLRSAPVSVGPFLRTAIWDRTPAILMSATLANGGDFTYLASELGLQTGEAVTYDAGTPFDYATQARLYVPPGTMASPKEAAWKPYALQATEHLVLASQGSALLLFTSWTNLNATYRALADRFAGAGLTVLKQGDATPKELLAEFRKGGAVLFGLKTFMVGVDVPGEALRLVVIDKLPFAVPSDILVSARADAYERKHGPKSSFRGITIPAMQLILNQASGRLIRHAQDKGVIAVLDSRLKGTGWGKQILGALPEAPVTTDIHEVAAFLAR